MPSQFCKLTAAAKAKSCAGHCVANINEFTGGFRCLGVQVFRSSGVQVEQALEPPIQQFGKGKTVCISDFNLTGKCWLVLKAD